jgi:hypothetical protein
MTTGVLSWVTVKDAAVAVGVSEARLRAAYRSGRLTVIEDLVAGRVRKLLDIDEVRGWAGVAPEPQPAAPLAAEAPVPPVEDTRFDDLDDRVKLALSRATRAEDQLSLVRNELAQLREVYLRVSDTLARREAADFEASVRTMCTTQLSDRRRRAGSVFGFIRKRATT